MSSEPGVFDAGRRLASSALAGIQSRLELATLEIGLASRTFFKALVTGLFGVLLLFGGILALSLCVVWLLWPQFGVWALAGMGLIYMLVGLGVLSTARSAVRSARPLLELTHAELRRDAAMLRDAPAAPDR